MEVAVSLTFLSVKSLGRRISSISRSPRCWVVWTEDLNPSKTPLNVNFFILVLATFQSSFSFFGSMMTNFSLFTAPSQTFIFYFSTDLSLITTSGWISASCALNMCLISVNFNSAASSLVYCYSFNSRESFLPFEWYIMDLMLFNRHCHPIFLILLLLLLLLL